MRRRSLTFIPPILAGDGPAGLPADPAAELSSSLPDVNVCAERELLPRSEKSIRTPARSQAAPVPRLKGGR